MLRLRREDSLELPWTPWPFRGTRSAVHGSPDRAALYTVVKARRVVSLPTVVVYGVYNREAGRRGHSREGIYMGELVADLFTSLDGHARGEGAPAYFGYPGPDLQRWIDDNLATPQVLLMGRLTYEMMLAIVQDQPVEGRDRMNELPKVVFSRTSPSSSSWPLGPTCEPTNASTPSRQDSGPASPPRSRSAVGISSALAPTFRRGFWLRS